MGSSIYKLAGPQNVNVFIYPEEMIVDPFRHDIEYSSIISIENIDEKQAVQWEKVIGLGIIFAPLAIVGYKRKEKRAITVIKYVTNAPESQTVVIDFNWNVDYAYNIISRRMNQSRRIIGADRAAILLTIDVASNPINVNEIQRLKIKAIDPQSNAAIPNARIAGQMISPAGQISDVFQPEVTNSYGEVSYTWRVSDIRGKFTAKFSAYAESYVESYAQSSFDVR
jgi:hypothetical protein